MNDVQLSEATGCSLAAADNWLPYINATVDTFEISHTNARLAAFLAQLAHESGKFHFVKEIWGPTAAQRGYEGRLDLGNTQPGDGYLYRGRGLIQITGRANYVAARMGIRVRGVDCPDFEADPDQLTHMEWAAMTAGWFWTDYKHLNELADVGDFERITRRINGGLNGYEERVTLWEHAQEVLA